MWRGAAIIHLTYLTHSTLTLQQAFGHATTDMHEETGVDTVEVAATLWGTMHVSIRLERVAMEQCVTEYEPAQRLRVDVRAIPEVWRWRERHSTFHVVMGTSLSRQEH